VTISLVNFIPVLCLISLPFLLAGPSSPPLLAALRGRLLTGETVLGPESPLAAWSPLSASSSCSCSPSSASSSSSSSDASVSSRSSVLCSWSSSRLAELTLRPAAAAGPSLRGPESRNSIIVVMLFFRDSCSLGPLTLFHMASTHLSCSKV